MMRETLWKMTWKPSEAWIFKIKVMRKMWVSVSQPQNPLEVSQSSCFPSGTFNHPWGGWNPSYHRRRWKLVCFPKLKWTVPFTRGIPSQDNIILGIWRLVKVFCNSPIDSLNLKDCKEITAWHSNMQDFTDPSKAFDQMLLAHVGRQQQLWLWVYWTTGRCYPCTPWV